ncbi:MAG: twin-arginine translocase TatA/TatE family subunit [Deferribacterales bacterium]|jgi:sec-independent protein translocase protein TatA/sec-independent protein translocase protein TatB
MFGLGMSEIILILAVALIVIGPKKLPEVAKGLGKGYAEFKKYMNDFKDAVNVDFDDDKPKKPAAPKKAAEVYEEHYKEMTAEKPEETAEKAETETVSTASAETEAEPEVKKNVEG